MNNKVNKALWVLRNEGPQVFISKTNRAFKRKVLNKNSIPQLSDNYLYLSNPLFNITGDDIKKSQEATKQKPAKVSSALWFVPYFDHVTYGGIYTIFRFIE